MLHAGKALLPRLTHITSPVGISHLWMISPRLPVICRIFVSHHQVLLCLSSLNWAN